MLQELVSKAAAPIYHNFCTALVKLLKIICLLLFMKKKSTGVQQVPGNTPKPDPCGHISPSVWWNAMVRLWVWSIQAFPCLQTHQIFCWIKKFKNGDNSQHLTISHFINVLCLIEDVSWCYGNFPWRAIYCMYLFCFQELRYHEDKQD